MVAETDSTQDDLLRLAADEGALPHLFGLRAERQLRGRGRTGRQWETSGVRALTVSFLLRPAAPLEEWSTFALRAGVGVIRALGEHGIAAELKWPNDIVVPTGRDVEGWHGIAKVGGVLGSVARDARGRHVCVIGIGINLSGRAPVPGAESLGTDVEAHALANEIRSHLAEQIPDRPISLPRLDSLMVRHCHTVGKRVVVTFPREEPPRMIRGVAVRIDPDGALVVDTGVGPERILNGDIAHTRLQAPIG